MLAPSLSLHLLNSIEHEDMHNIQKQVIAVSMFEQLELSSIPELTMNYFQASFFLLLNHALPASQTLILFPSQPPITTRATAIELFLL